MIRIVIILFILVFNVSTLAKPKIVTSITPIASIITMLIGDAAEVSTIDVSAGCPHHYQMRPSDKEKIADATMLIFINEHFEGFISRVVQNFQGTIVRISDFESINFLDDNGRKNWHFWLDLNNILALQNELSTILIEKFPKLTHMIKSNQNHVSAKIQSLIQLKKYELDSIKEIVVLSDSVEHFLNGMNNSIVRLYLHDNSSLKEFNKLEYTLSKDTDQCIIIDSNHDISSYRRFNKRIIQIDSENWTAGNNKFENANLFFKHYIKIIEQIKSCN